MNPGDQLQLTLINKLPPDTSSPGMPISSAANGTECGATIMDQSSTNIHFHGTRTSPVCHQDGVVDTLVNSGQTFTYNLFFPQNHPPGLYAYHPHVHGLAEQAVLGGASGAIVVEGIQNYQPAVAGLPEKILIIRDNPVEVDASSSNAPAWDISLNYIPIPFPNYNPVIYPIKPNETQFWRVANLAADTILNLTLVYDNVPQPLQVVARDGVPLDNQTPQTVTSVFLGPLGRAEFIMQGPSMNVQNATLMTQKISTGPDGDNDPVRPIAQLEANPNAPEPAYRIPSLEPTVVQNLGTVSNLLGIEPSTSRQLYFSEELLDPTNPSGPTNFFITLKGQTPAVFTSDAPPAITTTQGSVEDWVIENQAQEDHVFHIHQIHFVQLEANGVPVTRQSQQLMDTITLPFWNGTGPYPSVKIRMDFRDPVIPGTFVYHCHILGHEDNGMMAKIRVNPAPPSPVANSGHNLSPGFWQPALGSAAALLMGYVHRMFH